MHYYGMLVNSLLKLDRPPWLFHYVQVDILCFDRVSDPSKEGFLDLHASKVIKDFRLQSIHACAW